MSRDGLFSLLVYTLRKNVEEIQKNGKLSGFPFDMFFCPKPSRPRTPDSDDSAVVWSFIVCSYQNVDVDHL